MFYWALLAAVSDAVGDIFWKKSLYFWVWRFIHSCLWYAPVVPIALFFILTNSEYIPEWKMFFVFLFFIWIVWAFRNSLSTYVYEKEKFSTLIPFNAVNKTIVILVWFLYFKDTSILTALIWIITIIILILSNIDLKKYSLPKNIKLILTLELVTAIIAIGTGYLIIKTSAVTYFFWQNIFYAFILLSFAIYNKQLHTIKWLKKDFWLNRFWWTFIGWLWGVLYLFVIENLWVSLWVILWFLYAWITLVLSYIFLNDKPSKKDIILNIVIALLVWLAYYLK